MSKVLYHRDDKIARITLNRPEVHNAMDPETLCLLGDIFTEISLDDSVYVVIVTGAGEKSFSSGGDLATFIPLMSGQKKPENEWELRWQNEPALFDRAILRNFDIGKPVIAAINGSAIAGGMEFVQGTDLRIASDTAKFGVQEVKWGLFPAGGSSVRLPQQMTMPRAMELLLTGDLIDAKTALEWGFLNRVVPTGRVLDTAYDLAERIASNGPIAVRAVRESAYGCVGLEENEALLRETSISRRVFDSEDAREGPVSFLEKRAPVFQNK